MIQNGDPKIDQNGDPKIDQNRDPKSTEMGTQNRPKWGPKMGGPEMCDSGYFVTVEFILIYALTILNICGKCLIFCI